MNVTVQHIEEAAERLKHVVKHPPLELSKRLSEQYQATVYFKREDLQEVRSWQNHNQTRETRAQGRAPNPLQGSIQIRSFETSLLYSVSLPGSLTVYLF